MRHFDNEESYYDVQQVCLNGHQITDSYYTYPNNRESHCSECGEGTIHECPDCKEPIRGHYYVPTAFSAFLASVPPYCKKCGEAYPWTKKKIETQKQVESQSPVDSFLLLEKLCFRFRAIAKQLEKRRENRDPIVIKDEYDVQYLIHALLWLDFKDVRTEDYVPSYAGKNSRVDFLLKEENIVVEVKMARDNLKDKEIGEQLIIDSARYREHPYCQKLLCFVYDPDSWVANPKGLENDLNKKEDDFEVKVIIAPKPH